MKIGAVLLAAGLGTRFGGDKLRFEVEGVSLFDRAVAAVPARLFARAAAVAWDDALLDAAARAGYLPVRNTDPARGVSHSIALGLAEMEGTDAVLFSVCDQPRLRGASVVRLLDAYRAAPGHITALGWGQRRGNPVIFPKMYYPELRALTGDRGGGAVIARHGEAVRLVQAECAGELEDMDTPT